MGIKIDIVAGPDGNSSSVNVSGSIQHVITDVERGTFNIKDASLKAAVNAYFGKTPNDAYVRSPTPWGDLYQSYGWEQVQTVLVSQSAQILGITSQPVIVKTQTFTNNSSVAGDFNVGISEEVSNTVESTWNTGGELTIGQEINVSAKFLGTGGESTTSLSYSQSWGIGGTESKTVTVGSSSSVTVRLEPGQSVIAKLSASRGVMQVRIRYNAYLIGRTAVNYNPAFQGHHFWGLPIGNVMSSGGLSNSVISTEDMEIGYYSDSKIELLDPETKSVTRTVRLMDMPGGVR